MGKNKWVTIFEEIDIEKEVQLDIKVNMGEIGQSFVQDNFNTLLQLMYNLKKKIGYLTDNAKLQYIKDLDRSQPQLPEFGRNDAISDIMAQAFYQSDIYYFEFINEYKQNLIQKIEAAKSIEEPIYEQSKYKQIKDITTDFYNVIARQLYTSNYKIGGTNFFNEVDFIEAKHKQAPYVGKVFYLNLINAMPVFGEKLADETKGEIATYKEKIFKRVLNYCKSKVDEIENIKIETTLLSFTENNDYYESYIKNYWQKISIASNFIKKREFIESEIERITTKYLKPTEMKVMVNGTFVKPHKYFTFDIYSKMAFDWLSCGEDWTVSAIVLSAENQYKQVFSDDPEGVKHTIETGELKNSVIAQLKFGVSQLLYHKFLKKELEELDNAKQTLLIQVDNATHREIMIAYNFKVEAGIEKEKTASDWKKERGSKAYQQYYTVSYGKKNKPVTIKELKKVIELLTDFSTAQKLAINKLAELENL